MVGGLIVLEHYAYAVLHLGGIFSHGTKSRQLVAVGELIVFHVLLMMLMASYYQVVTTDPGYVPQSWIEKAEAESVVELESGEQPPYQMCGKCEKPRPPRSHHCSVCNRSVVFRN